MIKIKIFTNAAFAKFHGIASIKINRRRVCASSSRAGGVGGESTWRLPACLLGVGQRPPPPPTVDVGGGRGARARQPRAARHASAIPPAVREGGCSGRGRRLRASAPPGTGAAGLGGQVRTRAGAGRSLGHLVHLEEAIFRVKASSTSVYY